MPTNESIESLLATEIRKAIRGVRLYREYEFTRLRKWRFDIAIPKLKLAIEIEGRQHGRAKQHRSDCEKFNTALMLGWRVLRYPASTVLTKKRLPLVVAQIVRAILGVSDTAADVDVITR